MDDRKVAEQAIQNLENFFKNFMETLDQTIDAKIQKALQGKNSNDLDSQAIKNMVDQRFNENLFNFFKSAATQAMKLNNLEPITIETSEPQEISTNEESEDTREDSNQKMTKHQQYEAVIRILKGNKKAMRMKDITEILKRVHGVKWANPTNELQRMSKKYPVKKVGFGEYKYVGEK